MQVEFCPCGSKNSLKNCCGPLIDGEESASSPEALMRSRYSAFVLKRLEYIQETTDPQARSPLDMQANKEWAESAKFLGLEIIAATDEGNKGTVEFKATFQIGDQPPQVHHELSKFRKQGGVWYFRDGKLKTASQKA